MISKVNSFDDTEQYYLLNKDERVARFHIDTLLGAVVIEEQFVQLPERFEDLRIFIANRRAPKKRENMKKLLKVSGCDTLKGFIDVSHALSLTDTFWTKPVSSTLTWDEISLYTHPFNETIAKMAFEGGSRDGQFSTPSPEYSTDGSFAKCWIREADTIKMLKRGSSGARNAGLEPFSEFYASQIVKRFTNNCVEYGLRTHNGRICSVCDIFTSENYGFLPYAAVDSGNSTVASIIRKMQQYGLSEEVKRMFVIDAVIMNEDRHKNNFGFIVNNDTQEIECMAPLFDHNISLLPYAEEEDFDKIENYLAEKGSRIGDNWIPIAAACLTKETRKVLVGLKDFKFERHPKLNLPEWRLEALESTIHNQIQKILSIKAV